MADTESKTLLISRDMALAETLRQSLPAPGIELAAGVDEARSRLQRNGVSLVLLHVAQDADIRDAEFLLGDLQGQSRPPATLVLTERHVREQATRFLELGAADCLSQPLDLVRLATLAEVLCRQTRSNSPVSAKPPAVKRIGEEVEFLYLPSSQLAKMFEQVRAVAPQDTTVLLTGETGTGKTRLARVIHELSHRRADPFVVVDCGSLSGSIIESELFGHVKGAFTGGDTNRVGKFADAEQGTILLDEIDSLPLGLQSKLLRVVEERVFEPVGSNRSAPMRARLIVAANRPLEQEVAAGRFRSDLYFRLNVVRFNLPPLRDSRGLISGLAIKFVHEYRAQHNRLAEGITTEALHALEQYPWPGNVRELRNVIQRATILCPCQKIRIDDLPESLRRSDTAVGDNTPGPTLAQIRRDAEIGSIVHVLRKHNNNRRRAALELGISRVALYKKLRKYGMMVRKYPKSASHAQSIPA